MTGTNARGDPTTGDSPDDDAEGGLAALYGALAGLYREPPDVDSIEAVRTCCGTLERDPDLPADVSAAVETVLEAEADPSRLRPAFTDVFLGVDERRSPLPPYESLYVDGVLNGPSSTEVEAFYADAGYRLAVDDELVDHAAYELGFLAELCARGDRERQLAFVDTHVGAWLGEFHDAARETEPPAFYRGLFALTDAVLDLHASALEEAGVTIDQ